MPSKDRKPAKPANDDVAHVDETLDAEVDETADIPHPAPTIEVPKAPDTGPLPSIVDTARKIEEELDGAQSAIVDKLDRWLATLEGTSFEDYEQGTKAVEVIRRVVRRAGRELLFESNPITLQCVHGTGQKRPTIQVRGHSQGRRTVLLNSVRIPLLSTRSIR